ncbi:pre-mRNA-splicing factor SPF27-like [Oppia nitens]|uniref:pre-mRNA-splicing factor SPF27-like n=1 Tax=Oppia nitens TaxID=1686743 RepID=UPI0023DCDCE0|nr:pre-mRNA-splicing factor SPF27-like [Oppia nitens]
MSDILVDALPYIDLGYEEPGVREAVLEMVSEETRRYKPTKNYLENLSDMNLKHFQTDLLRNELERIENRQPMEMLSMKRYEMPGPAPGKMTDMSSWSESVNNSMAQLEHQAIRIDNLDLMQKFGPESWKQYNQLLTQIQSNAQKNLHDLRKRIQEVNWQRKSSQTAAGDRIRHLESEWVALVSKNYEIERQCLNLEIEIQESEQKLNDLQNNESNKTNNNNNNKTENKKL